MQVSFVSLFCSTQLLNMVMVRTFEVMLGEMLNHSEQNSVILKNVESL
jgi:hypothetical protein